MNIRSLTALTIFAALLFAGFVYAESQDTYLPLSQGQPRDQQSQPRDKSKIKSTTAKKITNILPALVEDKGDPNPKNSSSNNGGKENTYLNISYKEDPMIRYTFWLMIFTGVLAISTIGLWVVTLFARKDTKKAVGAAQKSADAAEKIVLTMQDTAQRQLRAYICIPGATIKLIKKSDSMYAHVVLRYKNAGQTPGYDVKTWIALDIAEYPLNKILVQHPQDAKYTPIIISPGSEQYLVNETVITPEQRPMIGTAKATLYVYGEVLYRDVFGIERFTKYRLLYGGDEGTFGEKLRPDLEGNEADYSQAHNQPFNSSPLHYMG